MAGGRYALHLPPASRAGGVLPLVIVLHGSGGTGQQTATLTGMNAVADRKGSWSRIPMGSRGAGTMAGSAGRSRRSGGVDDVGFVAALIDELVRTRSIDGRRVFVTGISNGGMMTERLGCELADKVAAIAPVAGPLSETLDPRRVRPRARCRFC